MVDPTKLIEAGPLGVVVLLVAIFIWYIDRRDKAYQDASHRRDTQWQDFTKQQRTEDNSVIRDLMQQVKDLATQLVALRDDFNDHNTWERARLNEMLPQIMEPKTQPRRRE
jgi:predicted histidine transporter YuiF (NhaC family)